MDSKTRRSRNYHSLTYFYWDKHLCKKLTQIRPENLMYAWDYTENRRVSILLSDWKKHREPALTTAAVSRLTGVSIDRIYFAINSEKIPAPQRPNPPQHHSNVKVLPRIGYMWSEEDIMNLHDWITSQQRGRPRKDGLPRRHAKILSKAEIRSRLRGEVQIFVQNDQGEFIPIWKEV